MSVVRLHGTVCAFTLPTGHAPDSSFADGGMWDPIQTGLRGIHSEVPMLSMISIS